MKYAFSLTVSLAAFWLLNSGHFDPILLALGLVSVVLVVGIALRMTIVDTDHPSLAVYLRAIGYFAWLMKEIVLANLHVVRRIWALKPQISPTLITLEASQVSDLGKVIYANSITLTPGTITLEITGNQLQVHTLTREAAQDLLDDQMNKRVKRVEGECI